MMLEDAYSLAERGKATTDQKKKLSKELYLFVLMDSFLFRRRIPTPY